MRRVIAVLSCAALLVGIVSLAGRGRGHEECHPAPCDPCMQLVDLTPKKKWDCVYACAPIPGCVP